MSKTEYHLLDIQTGAFFSSPHFRMQWKKTIMPSDYGRVAPVCPMAFVINNTIGGIL